MSRLQREAANRLKDIQRAEDDADEALRKFGTNIRDFFRDAIVVRAAPAGAEATGNRFESKDDSGKRVIHSSRYDAQLHVLHTTEKSFTEDPATAEFATWAKAFDAEAKTDSISADLAKYPELRANMEKLVPDRVPYADFWKRYYFLRHSIETADARRRDLLKGQFISFIKSVYLTVLTFYGIQPHLQKRRLDGVMRSLMRSPKRNPRSRQKRKSRTTRLLLTSSPPPSSLRANNPLASQQTRSRDPAPPGLRRQSSHLPPPSQPHRSLPSRVNPTTRSHKLIATLATMW